jgi:hypothetical protein
MPFRNYIYKEEPMPIISGTPEMDPSSPLNADSMRTQWCSVYEGLHTTVVVHTHRREGENVADMQVRHSVKIEELLPKHPANCDIH